MKDLKVEKFEDMHNIHNYKQLPKPEGLNYLDMFGRYCLQSSLDNWIKSFEKKEQSIKEFKSPKVK